MARRWSAVSASTALVMAAVASVRSGQKRDARCCGLARYASSAAGGGVPPSDMSRRPAGPSVHNSDGWILPCRRGATSSTQNARAAPLGAGASIVIEADDDDDPLASLTDCSHAVMQVRTAYASPPGAPPSAATSVPVDSPASGMVSPPKLS